jgi:NAD(P)H dehydrogenase (quinone)
MKVAVIFYSTYGHLYQMAEAAAEGIRQGGNDAEVLRVAETLPQEVLEKMGAAEASKVFAHIPEAKVEDLTRFDGFIFAFPTRFGNMAAQFKTFVDATGALWAQGALIGKPFGIITGSATQHGGQESTILTGMVPFLHHGMLFVGLPASLPELGQFQEVQGGSYYGASTIAGPDGSRMPSENELKLASALGSRVASVAAKLTTEVSLSHN